MNPPSSLSKLHFSPLALAAIVSSFALAPVRADDLYIWAEEVGGNVIFFHQGSIDLTGFPLPSVVGSAAVIAPDSGAYSNATANIDLYDDVLPIGTSRPFGPGGVMMSDSRSGDNFGLSSIDELGLPVGYTSGSPISGSLTFNGTTLAGLGVIATPFSFNTIVGSNTIHMFTDPADVAAAAAARAAAISDLVRKIRKLKKKARKAKKQGKVAKAKRLLKKLKKLKKQLAALG